MPLKPRSPLAIIRLDDLTDAVQISRAILDGGITTQEYTLTNADALPAIGRVRRELGASVCLGIGTVLNGDAARRSIEAGAEFLVTPVVALDVIAAANAARIPVVCGAMTPTEIWTAAQAGAAYIKLFPARSLGPQYLKDVLAPLPGLKFVPTGGVDLNNCTAFLDAGAYTVAIGGNLVSAEIVHRRDWPALTERARRFVAACEG